MTPSDIGRPPLVRKQYPLTIDTIKAVGEDDEDAGLGVFGGSASVYNVIDLHGDVIEPGACEVTLREKGDSRPLLWQHWSDKPMGLAHFADSASALLLTKGVPNGEVQVAREGMALVKQGAITGLSIGFNIVEESWDSGIRMIQRIDLWEVSLVTFPANPLAQITEAKSAQVALAELQAAQLMHELKAGRVLSKANRSKVEAAVEALQDVLLADADKNDKDAGTGAGGSVPTSGQQALASLLDEIRSHRKGI